MLFDALDIDPTVTRRNHRIERLLNRVVRSTRRRVAPYDDDAYEFVDGASDGLRKKHYDKSLRLLWKAERHAPWSDFRDCTSEEKQLWKLGQQALDQAERKQLDRINSAEYRAFLNEQYTVEQKQAIVNILAMIGHGEAYAWLVSTELLQEAKSTGAKAALTMQVLEEAKHFVVLRELIRAFDVPIPRMNVYEYVLLERTLKSKGFEKFFGMNVVVEGFALSLFGMLSALPGLEILELFHLDESRHTGLPHNYFSEFPMTWWQKRNPKAQLRRLTLILPALPILTVIEKDLAVLGIDAFEFGGSLAHKILHLSERVGFHALVPREELEQLIEWLFNQYCAATREGHEYKAFMSADTTAERVRPVEYDAFGLSAVPA